MAESDPQEASVQVIFLHEDFFGVGVGTVPKFCIGLDIENRLISLFRMAFEHCHEVTSVKVVGICD